MHSQWCSQPGNEETIFYTESSGVVEEELQSVSRNGRLENLLVPR
jgi:hypothetical protein